MKISKDLISLATIGLITCLIFFKIFTSGLFPFPGNLLVSFYFPWYSGEWEGYDPWTTHKELLNADAIRQIYLWKEFAIQEFKNGTIPLWNPYTFSGQPLLANFQSSVFYPLNFFYFVTDVKNAWVILIVTQPLLGGIFMYLAARSISLLRYAAIFAASAFMFSSYLITWMENGNIAHGYIWLPLVFFSIQKYFLSPKIKIRYLALLAFSLSMSILAGHPQTAIYIYLFTVIFYIYKVRISKKIIFDNLLLVTILTVSLSTTAVQLLPTFELYKMSPLSLAFSREVFDRSLLPIQNLVTFLASDFFGNPASNNYWSQNYGDFTPYLGVVPFIFALWAIYNLFNRPFVKFAAITALVFILAAIPGPITYLIRILNIPIINSTTPSRFVSISIFLFVILSAIAFSNILENVSDKKFQKKFFKFLTIIGFFYFLLWLFALTGAKFLKPQDTWLINLSVTRRNLILPTMMFLTIPSFIIGINFLRSKVKITKNQISVLFFLFTLGVVLLGGIYYTNKFLPTSPKKFFFPDHLVFTWLQQNAGINRFYGGGTAHVDFNFPTHFKIFAVEGYDTLRLERYAQLLASSFEGKVPSQYRRSDAVVPGEDTSYRKRILDILGVKYLLDKEDNVRSGADFRYDRYPNDNIIGLWQRSKFQLYLRQDALPRAFLSTRYKVAQNDDGILQDIYNLDFNLQTIILEKEPPVPIVGTKDPIVPLEPTEYSPNRASFQTNLPANSILFLSDAFEKNWNVYIDSKKSELLRADFAFRAVAVPAGSHTVNFVYEPKSVLIGATITLVSIVLTLLSLVYLYFKKLF